MSKRVIKIIGQLDSEAYRTFSDELDVLENQSNKPITIELCSEGGETYIGLAIYGKLKTSKCRTIIIAYGQVMSAATIILAAGDKRVIHVDAWFMIHDDIQRIRADNTTIAISEATQTEKLEGHWAKIMARETGTPEITWREFSRKTTYLDADQCVLLGVADEVLGK